MIINAQLAAGVAIALCAALGVQSWRLHTEQRDHALAIARYEQANAERERIANKAQSDYDQKAQADRERAQRANDDAKKKLDTMAANLAAAGTERTRLRNAYSAALNRSCPAAGTPTIAGPSAPASAPANLPADMFGGIDDAAQELAEFADRAMSAVEACAAAW